MAEPKHSLTFRWLTASAEVDAGTRRQLLNCWRDVSNAGGAVGFPFLPVDDAQVLPAVDAMVDSLDPVLNRLLLANVGQALAGWLLLVGNTSKLTAHWATVLRVQTALAHRGTGVGGSMMTEAARAARDDLGLQQLHLELRAGLELESFYGGRGWQEIGKWPIGAAVERGRLPRRGAHGAALAVMAQRPANRLPCRSSCGLRLGGDNASSSPSGIARSRRTDTFGRPPARMDALAGRGPLRSRRRQLSHTRQQPRAPHLGRQALARRDIPRGSDPCARRRALTSHRVGCSDRRSMCVRRWTAATVAPRACSSSIRIERPARERSGIGSRPVSRVTQARFVVVREFKRHLVGYLWVIALREFLRVPSFPVEARRGSVVLAGLLTSPFVVCAFAWWVLTGRRLRGRLGAWLLAPTVVRVNVFRKLPAILLEDSAISGRARE